MGEYDRAYYGRDEELTRQLIWLMCMQPQGYEHVKTVEDECAL